MRTFSIILADDEQNILYGMQKGINWEKLGFIVAGTAQNGKDAAGRGIRGRGRRAAGAVRRRPGTGGVRAAGRGPDGYQDALYGWIRTCENNS